jgi:hypothetical protein
LSVEPIPHTVTPAVTNYLAVLGEFPRGSTTQAGFVSSWTEFTSLYGPLSASSSLAAYAVSQFFLNGGIGAWIVRLSAPGAGTARGNVAPLYAPDCALTITANSEGRWAEGIIVSLEPAGPASKPSDDHVNLVVRPAVPPGSPSPPPLETIAKIALVDANHTPLPPRQVAAMITDASSYVTAEAASPMTPESAEVVLTGGVDGGFDGGSFLAAVEAELDDGARLTQLAPSAFNLMCIPDLAVQTIDVQTGVFAKAHDFCAAHQAFLLLDPPPPERIGVAGIPTVDAVGSSENGLGDLMTWGDGFLGPDHVAAATYYPWVQITDPVTTLPRLVPPSGTVAGVYAATDTASGVWKAAAGMDAGLQAVSALADTTITDEVNGEISVEGINCLRTFPVWGSVVWGARTLAGSDMAESPFKYVPVRRLALFIEQSLQQSLRWVVFEPNGPALWSSIALEVTAFMGGLWSAGAFAGATAATAYSVVCDATTTSTDDILSGIVNVNVSFAPVYPGEFVIWNIQIDAAPTASEETPSPTTS